MQETLDLSVLKDWEDHVYEDEFVVKEVYDGPINGWYYVHWGEVYCADRRVPREYYACSCEECSPPCVEDRVPEAELMIGAPLALADYKRGPRYVQRVFEAERAAILTLEA